MALFQFSVHFLCSIDSAAKLAKFSDHEIMCRNSFPIHLFCLIHFFYSLIHFPKESKLQSSNDKWIKKDLSHWRTKNFLISSGCKIKLVDQKASRNQFRRVSMIPLANSFFSKNGFPPFLYVT